MEADTAGDPMTGLKWTRRTTAKIAAELKAIGIDVSPKTVAQLLKQLGFSLRVNQKKVARTVNVTPQERDAQFAHIAELRELCAAQHVPVISVDTKKKELIGNFKNAGQAWSRNCVAVNDHDFRSQADGIAVPFSIYDLRNNKGFVCVGTSYDTHSLPLKASPDGGAGKENGAIRALVNSSYYPTQVAAMGQNVEYGNTSFIRSCATTTVSPLQSPITQAGPQNGTQLNTGFIVKYQRTGQDDLWKTWTPY